ncbi:MAG: hypothetical protein ACRENE_00800, partial [Polyangiaceae bacterium]
MGERARSANIIATLTIGSVVALGTMGACGGNSSTTGAPTSPDSGTDSAALDDGTTGGQEGGASCAAPST